MENFQCQLNATWQGATSDLVVDHNWSNAMPSLTNFLLLLETKCALALRVNLKVQVLHWNHTSKVSAKVFKNGFIDSSSTSSCSTSIKHHLWEQENSDTKSKKYKVRLEICIKFTYSLTAVAIFHLPIQGDVPRLCMQHVRGRALSRRERKKKIFLMHSLLSYLSK